MIKSFIASFLKEEDGQDMVEYCLLLAFTGLAATAALTAVRTSINGIWTAVQGKLSTAATDAAQ